MLGGVAHARRAVEPTSDLPEPSSPSLHSKGYNDGADVAHELIPRIAEWGAAAVTLHGRTRQQRYSRVADWEYIGRCGAAAAAAGIPLVGNGDILAPSDWEAHMATGAVATCMIGRGALMKPWIFTGEFGTVGEACLDRSARSLPCRSQHLHGAANTAAVKTRTRQVAHPPTGPAPFTVNPLLEIKEQRLWDISAGERFDHLRQFASYGLEHWGSDARGVETTRRFLLEWLSFTHRWGDCRVRSEKPTTPHCTHCCCLHSNHAPT
jgi:tRNA-dihydrouridine synthase 3